MNTIMKDRYGNELHVTMLVVSRVTSVTHLDGQYLTAGTIYPAGFLLNGDLAVIDAENEVTPVRPGTVTSLASLPGEAIEFASVDRPFTRAGFCEGDVVPVLKSIANRHINKGCVWCKNQEGKWIAMSKVHLTFLKPKMSAAAMTARMKSATEAGTSQTITIVTTHGCGAGGSDIRSMGGVPSQAFNFIPDEVKLDRVVLVEFSKGGKLYTYRLKDGMIAEPGDDAVVIVNNPAYPELKGTKVVRVKEVDTVENLGGSYKYVEHIVSNEEERKAQQEVKRKRAESRLTKKRAELNSALKEARRIETELNQLAEDFHNGKY